MRIGSYYLGGGRCEFTVWAPLMTKVELHIISPEDRIFPMERDEGGYWKIVADGVQPGCLYWFRLDETRDRPDPASHLQPQGVHGPSEVIDHSVFTWEDGTWKGYDLCQMIIYEVHVGTFTPEGTFDGVVSRFDDLKDLGVNTILIMPVAQSPGTRNWGYDGTYLFAVQNSYGGTDGFKRLINECHKRGFAVKLDVVYNHLGPEGCYVREFGPYFTDAHKSPWGQAVNVDMEYSDGVRNYYIENALYWLREFHVDVLRMDAADRIYDISAYPFLQELADKVGEFSMQSGTKRFLVAEADQNDPKLISPMKKGGFGLDAQWCDDFHHCIHTLLTGEREGYYVDYGRIEQMAKSIQEGFVYSGEHSFYRKARRGRSSKDIPGYRFVVFSQNHDQVGNRLAGDRLTRLVHFEALKLAAGVVLLSPYIPLLFMGEEYGEEAPFLYFVNHSDPELIKAVREGRKMEFTTFAWEDDPSDPEAEETFLQSKLQWEKRSKGKHKALLDFYRTLIRLRKETPALSNCDKRTLSTAVINEDKRIILMRRWQDDANSHVFCIFNFGTTDARVFVGEFLPQKMWKKVLDSSDAVWNGPGAVLPDELYTAESVLVREHSVAVYERMSEK
ncbi:MAG: malto-oligosyltrehalose trehalohydrolase [Thermodesulfobacteriota bacterium]